MTPDLPPDDASLIRNVQTGTPAEAEEAFRQLVLRHSSRLFMHLRKTGLASDEQKDVASETWFRVWQKISNFQDRGIDIFSWIRKIADYVSKEHFRSKITRDNHEQLGEFTDGFESEQISSLHDKDPPAYEVLSIIEFREVAQQLLENAPKEYKEIIEARYFVDLTPDEIGLLYGWSRSKVDTTHFRAIAWLKARFQERYGTQDWIG